MFDGKFFSTVALSSAAVSLAGNIGSAFAAVSDIVLTCKDGGID